MRVDINAGMTLIELLFAMAIASITGAMIMQLIISFQASILAEISRNDLHDRAERLIRFVANDISDSAFQLGAVPQVADGSRLQLTHDSLPGDPVEDFPSSILPEDVPAGNDRVTIIKAESFFPPIRVAEQASADDYFIQLNRRPNRSPGSTRELLPEPEAINHLVFANHRRSYSVRQPDQALELTEPLLENVPAGTEVLGVRAFLYYLDPFSGSNRLRRDDYTSRAIIDDAVDGLQFEYLLDDGSMVSQPERLQEIRGVRISVLVRDLRADRGYRSQEVFSLGNRIYGPFQDHYRRLLLTRMVEVKNFAIQ